MTGDLINLLCVFIIVLLCSGVALRSVTVHTTTSNREDSAAPRRPHPPTTTDTTTAIITTTIALEPPGVSMRPSSYNDPVTGLQSTS